MLRQTSNGCNSAANPERAGQGRRLCADRARTDPGLRNARRGEFRAWGVVHAGRLLRRHLQQAPQAGKRRCRSRQDDGMGNATRNTHALRRGLARRFRPFSQRLFGPGVDPDRHPLHADRRHRHRARSHPPFLQAASRRPDPGDLRSGDRHPGDRQAFLRRQSDSSARRRMRSAARPMSACCSEWARRSPTRGGASSICSSRLQ